MALSSLLGFLFGAVVGFSSLFVSLDSTQGCRPLPSGGLPVCRWTGSVCVLRLQAWSFAETVLSSAGTTPPLPALTMTWQLGMSGGAAYGPGFYLEGGHVSWWVPLGQL